MLRHRDVALSALLSSVSPTLIRVAFVLVLAVASALSSHSERSEESLRVAPSRRRPLCVAQQPLARSGLSRSIFHEMTVAAGSPYQSIMEAGFHLPVLPAAFTAVPVQCHLSTEPPIAQIPSGSSHSQPSARG